MPARASRQRRRELSQHFLRDPALATSLVRDLPLAPGTFVVEVGPGTGRLTAPLAERCRRVLGVEVDAELAGALQARFADLPHVDIRRADFADLPLPRERYSLVSNLPFARTAEFVRRLTRAERPPDDAWLIVEAGAARRFAGEPWAEESLQSLLLKPTWHVEIARSLPRSAFVPVPSVDAALLWLARRGRPLLAGSALTRFRSFVSGHYRKRVAIDVALRPSLTRPQRLRLARELRFRLDTPCAGVRFEQWLGIFRAQQRLPARSARSDARSAISRGSRRRSR